MTRSYQDSLADIVDAIEKALEFVERVDFQEFDANAEKVFAVIRALEIIGEAARHIPADVRNTYPDIPWADMIGMRNVVIHEYFGVDNDVIWRTIQEDLPPLRKSIVAILEDMPKLDFTQLENESSN